MSDTNFALTFLWSNGDECCLGFSNRLSNAVRPTLLQLCISSWANRCSLRCRHHSLDTLCDSEVN